MGTENRTVGFVMATNEAKGQMPTGRVTFMGVCDCGENHPMIRYEDTGEICDDQSLVMIACNKLEGGIESLYETLDNAPPELIAAVTDDGEPAEVSLAKYVLYKVEERRRTEMLTALVSLAQRRSRQRNNAGFNVGPFFNLGNNDDPQSKPTPGNDRSAYIRRLLNLGTEDED